LKREHSSQNAVLCDLAPTDCRTHLALLARAGNPSRTRWQRCLPTHPSTATRGRCGPRNGCLWGSCRAVVSQWQVPRGRSFRCPTGGGRAGPSSALRAYRTVSYETTEDANTGKNSAPRMRVTGKSQSATRNPQKACNGELLFSLMQLRIADSGLRLINDVTAQITGQPIFQW